MPCALWAPDASLRAGVPAMALAATGAVMPAPSLLWTMLNARLHEVFALVCQRCD